MIPDRRDPLWIPLGLRPGCDQALNALDTADQSLADMADLVLETAGRHLVQLTAREAISLAALRLDGAPIRLDAVVDARYGDLRP